MAEPTSEFARRIGSRAAIGNAPRRGGAWALHVCSAFLLFPLLVGLVTGAVGKTLGSLGAIVALQAAGVLIRRGLAAEAEYHERLITKAPPSRKLAGIAFVALAAFILGALGTNQPFVMAIVFAALAGFGAYVAYGPDPRGEKGIDQSLSERAGLKTEQVIAALDEARAKIGQIEAEARAIQSRDLKERLRRITGLAHSVLRQIEKDPGDLRRARRFLVTYLDGTRDVVTGYRKQQQDLASTPLADNFRHVLETVERVFGEQQEILKRNESLDLEVQIEVLKTQLEREGVH